MNLKLYNSLTRRLEPFEPLIPGRVGIYVCGPTVYGHAHLGHAKSYVSFDALVRYLKYKGYVVTYVQNITDVGHLTDDADSGQDKIARQAALERKHPMAVAEFYTRSFFEDMDLLNCLRPDISPRATGHISEQIELVKTLLQKGFAYEVNGSVYFEVARFEDYGSLSGRKIEDMIAGARIEVSTEKRHPADFALWKRAEPNHIMQWPSPWGMGYPGWHLECSAMSMKYLGSTIDIHGGGIENIFPHHECEIAQSEAATGKQFVRYWLHNNMVTVDGQKMGKSLNNFITLKQAFTGNHPRLTKAYKPMAIRLFILTSHYRSTLDFSDAALTAADRGLDKIRQAVVDLENAIRSAPEGPIDRSVQVQIDGLKARFEHAMDEDLNTAIAVSVIYDLVRLIQTTLASSAVTRQTIQALRQTFDLLAQQVLGIKIETDLQCPQILDGLIELLIQQRASARNAGDYAKADAIRNKLQELGIQLKDTPSGTQWSLR